MAKHQPRSVWAGASQCERRLHVEHLERRRLLAVVTVDTELDVVNPTDGLTSLREAINTTNADPGPDEIVFDFGHDGPATILLQQGELEITEALTITGDGPGLLSIDAQEQSRIFNITADTGDFSIAGMTLTNGRTTGDNPNLDDNTFHGGAIRSPSSGMLTVDNSTVSDSSTTGSFVNGGGIWASGNITISSSTISGNSASGFEGGGGGVFAHGKLTVIASNVSNNLTGVSGGTSGNGGSGINARGDVTVISSTISGNRARDSGDGGGINADGNVTVTSSTIANNSASGSNYNYGGGIRAQGDVTVTHSSISGNSSGYNGGGIFADGEVTIASSTISDNLANPFFGFGGGIYAHGDVTATSSTISGNDAGWGGGGIVGVGVTVTSSSISGNSTGSAGGGGIRGSDVTVTSSTISGNSASSNEVEIVFGGGISGSDVTVTSSTVSGNSISGGIGYGGGILAFGNVTVASSTVSENSISGNFGFGGGILGSGDVTISSSTISSNSIIGGLGSDGGGIAAHGDVAVSSRTVSNSIVAGNWLTNDTEPTIADDLSGCNSLFAPGCDSGIFRLGFSVVGAAVDGINTLPGTINYIGLDPLLGPLAYNGGPTETQALLPGSPALDAGDPTIQQDLNEFDQRGAPFLRVADGNLPDDIAIDIGAYEAQAPSSADFDQDGNIDGHDFLLWQRGYGMTVGATRPDGNSDDDRDVDNSDLAAWKVTFGEAVAPLAASRVGSAPSALPVAPQHDLQSVSAAKLIDLAIFAELVFETIDDEDLVVMAHRAVVDNPHDAAFATDHILPVTSGTIKEDSRAKSSAEGDDAEDPWLADELLERVLGQVELFQVRPKT